MKVTVRTLTGAKYDIILEEDSKVSELKQKVQSLTGDDPSTQTLIFSGKFMEDDKNVAEYNIKEKDFIVLTAKPVARPKTTTPTTTNTPTNTSTTNTTNTSTPTQQPRTQPTQQPTQQPGEEMATGESLEDAVKDLVEMGFDAGQALQALKMAMGNRMRAVDILTSGALDNYTPSSNPTPTPSTPPQGGSTDPTGSPGGTGAQGIDNPMLQQMFNQYMNQGQQQQNIFAPLRNNPFFSQIRAMVQIEPGLLEPILQRIEQTQPDLIQVITQNQQQFLDFLNEPVSPEIMAQTQQALGQMMNGLGGMGGAMGGQQQRFQITEEENQVINNLVEMGGFDRNKVIEAYFLFDKDETMTAEYLLRHGFDDEPDDQQ
jgi:UV excision repair protein RAD23